MTSPFRPKALTLLLPTALALAGVSADPAASHGQDFVRDSVPQKWIEPLLPEQLPELEYPKYFDDFDKAKLQSFTGRYKLSLSTLRNIKDPKPEQKPQVAVIASRSLAALGRWDEALKALSDPAVEADPAVRVRRAEVLTDMGRAKEAVDLLQKHIEADPKSIAGHHALGVAAERVGDLETAKKAYGWFVEEPQNFLERWQLGERGAPFDDAETLTLIGRSADRWAMLTGAYANNAKLHHSMLDLFVAAYDRVSRGYWPARLAAAEYFLSHDSMAEAEGELKGSEEDPRGVLSYNPNSIDAHNLLATLALSVFQFDAADKSIAAIRKVDPRSAKADLLEARNLLQQRRPKDAEGPIQRVLARQPENLEALGLQAAVYALQLQEEKTSEVLRKVEKLDPDNASAYFEVAEQLGAMRQYPRAAEKYEVAIERAPWWTDALNGLGLLHTQSGDEDAARAVLERARTVDPFNHRTTNYLKLLDQMAQYARKETEHFILLYDAKQDPLIPEYFSDYLESIHAEVAGDFAHDPVSVVRGKGPDGQPIFHKTIIEVFPTHDAFSVRTTGSPWIGTVGASTGRVIALVAPRKGENTMGTFNWASVLRHEYTHTVTLSATDNRIAHWMTEGLAVLEEKAPLRWDWVPMLNDAVKKKELFPLDQLTWGFVRPKKPHHRTLAYAQAHWVCQYIQEKYGHKALIQMLEEFRNANTEAAVFEKITGKKAKEFEKDFFAWCEQQVAKWGYDEATTKKYTELRKQADALIKGKQFDQAIAAYEEIVKLRPMDAMPHQKLAGLYLKVKQYPKAIAHLETLHKVELKDNRYAKRIARIYRDNNEFDKAAKVALEAVYIDPYDLSAHELLAEIYEKSGDKAGLERERRVIPVLTQWIENQKKAADGAGANDEGGD